MCGIAGIYDFKNDLAKQDIVAMNDCLSHRGPDAREIHFAPPIALGHNRLSILDLSENANQPMYSEDKRFVIVFNGEVYNYRELAKDLNYKARTTSDTEVILEAFIRLGPSFVNRLNGMFAIAIYDSVGKELFLFRDRLGVKPLYYSLQEDSFLFASELKAFAAVKKVKEKLTYDPNAIRSFLHLGYIPQPLTIYKQIQKFPSGSFAKVTSNEFKIERYWAPENFVQTEMNHDFSSAKKTLKELLESSVNYRMISDVPFGTFLSGGIDSSLVTAIAQKISPVPVNTFSIGFSEGKYNELPYSGSIARYLKTNHHEFVLSEIEAMDLLTSVMDNYDEPFADASAIPTFMVSKLARQHVKMTLSGDGGDELFFGYGAYRWAERLDSAYVNALKKPIHLALSKLGNNRMKRAASLFDFDSKKNIRSHIFSQEQYLFSEKETLNILNNKNGSVDVRQNFDNLSRKLSSMEKQAMFDINYYLRDDLLVKVDRASMQCSLETREPLLDYRIVEFALNLDPGLKVKDGVSKYLLKEILYDYIPKEYFARKKWGFSIPLESWLKNQLRFLIDDYLNEDKIIKTGIFNYSSVKILKDRFLKGEDFLFNRIWVIIILQRWMIKNNF